MIVRGLRTLLILTLFSSSALALEGTLLVANRSGGSISFIDLTTGIEMARVPIGPVIPHEVAVSPDGRRALTSAYGSNRNPGRHVVVMDVATATIAGRIDLGPDSRPHATRFLPDGRRGAPAVSSAKVAAPAGGSLRNPWYSPRGEGLRVH